MWKPEMIRSQDITKKQSFITVLTNKGSFCNTATLGI